MTKNNTYQRAKHRFKMPFRYESKELFVSANQSFMHVHARAGVNFDNVIM